MWVKLYTKLLNWEWYKNVNVKTLFIHCLLKANWKDGKYEGEDVPRGSFVTGRKQLAKETGLTEQQVRTALTKLKSTKEITIKTTKKYTIISIENYDLYQEINQDSNFQVTNKQPTSNHNLRIIEYKNNINTYYYLEQQFGRTLTSVEYEKLSNWQKWFSDDVINYAIDITIMNGARALSYTEAIINSWHDKGYKTLEDCKNEKTKERELSEIFEYDWLNEE